MKNCKVELNIAKELELLGYDNIFSNVMLILIDNSLDAYENSLNNHIKITIEQNEHLNIIIYEDNAGGIKIEPIEQIFDYFVTTKNENDSSHGFGLAIAKLLIENILKGSIRVENTSLGAKFKLLLP